MFFRVDHSPNTGYHIESSLYEYQRWSGPWFHFWMWESLPDMRPQVALKPRSEGIATLAQAMTNPELKVGTKSRFEDVN